MLVAFPSLLAPPGRWRPSRACDRRAAPAAQPAACAGQYAGYLPGCRWHRLVGSQLQPGAHPRKSRSPPCRGTADQRDPQPAMRGGGGRHAWHDAHLLVTRGHAGPLDRRHRIGERVRYRLCRYPLLWDAKRDRHGPGQPRQCRRGQRWTDLGLFPFQPPRCRQPGRCWECRSGSHGRHRLEQYQLHAERRAARHHPSHYACDCRGGGRLRPSAVGAWR